MDIKKLTASHEAAPQGQWVAQTYSCAKDEEPEDGVSIYIGDDSFGSFVFGGGWQESELLSAAQFLAEAHNQFPDIVQQLEQVSQLENALRGLMSVIKHYETGYFIDRSCFEEMESAEKALSAMNNIKRISGED